jgi:hypothetical protein
MLGRACPGQPGVRFETGRQLTRRFENVQRAKEELWGRWIREVFPELLKQRKWIKDKRDVKVGDIVFRKNETAASQTFKYARVTKVHVGTDGKVRSVDIEYRLPGETRYRTTTRPIHKMVLIIPVEEQMIGSPKSIEKEAEATEPETRKLEAVDKKGAQATKEDEPPRARGVTKNDPPGTREVKGKSVQKIKHKKINPRKKAGKQTRTIVVTVPEKSEEIRDAGTIARRKRGDQRSSREQTPQIHARGVFRTLEREYAGILGEGTPFWEWGAPVPQRGRSSIS